MLYNNPYPIIGGGPSHLLFSLKNREIGMGILKFLTKEPLPTKGTPLNFTPY